MRKIALGTGIIALLALAAGAWLLTDLNRFRPQVEALIAEQAGLDIEILGDLGWRLLPMPAVTVERVQSVGGEWQVDEWRYDPIRDHHAVRGFHFQAQGAEGRCDLEFRPRHSTSTAPQANAQGLVQIQALHQVNGSGRCGEVHLRFGDQRFEDLTVEFEVVDGTARLDLHAPSVYGGSASARIEADAAAEPVDWNLRFNADRLRAQDLKPWLAEAVVWEAELAYEGEFQMQGNSLPELAASIVGESRLDGGPGRVGAPFLDQIKKAASPFARGAGKAAPGPVSYQSLAGTWSIDGSNQRLNVTLDNLVLKAKGAYHVAEDRMDMTAKVAIEEGGSESAFEANPLLTGISIPLRCAGALAEAACELDGSAVRRLLAEAAKDGSEMQRKVDAIIDEKLPPKQRQAARAVLRLLGGSIKEDGQEM